MADEISKWMKRIDFIVVALSLIIVVWLVGYGAPLVIAPQDDLETTSTAVLFEFSNADKILLDDNLEFSSPEEIYAKDNLVINLKPGVYYWKVVGFEESEIRELTIKSEVGLKLQESDDGKYEVVNAGNVGLDVEIFNKGTFVGKTVLEPEESSLEKGDKFVGGENE
ncbi:hypothetical protein J4402_01850 [Candidatus Pacearchaeota archaeon]|nr:hypothetical protein [Candidatus Pacearchaeota archaeon]